MFAILRDLIRYNLEFAIGLVLFGIVVIYALLSFFSPVDPTLIYIAPPDMPPSAQYWFGTNSRGQDMFWQLSTALRNTLGFGLTVAILSRVISSKERGLYMGVQQTFGGMARVLFPILFGYLYDKSSGLPFLVSASFVLFTLYLGVGMDSYARTDAKAAAA